MRSCVATAVIAAYASNVTASNANTLLADFDLTSVPVGTYSLKITTGSQTDHAFQRHHRPSRHHEAFLAPVQFSLDAPSTVRFGHVYDLLVKYTNPNNVDVPAPIFQLSQPNAEFELVSGNFGAKINPDTTFSDGSIELLAMNQEGPAGVLPPNYTGVYDIRFTAIQRSSALHRWTSPSASPIPATTTFDLSSLVQPGPDGVSEVTAEILAAQINGLSALPTDHNLAVQPFIPNLPI